MQYVAGHRWWGNRKPCKQADSNRLDQFVDQADQALLVAKRSGRDRVIGFQAMQAGAVVPVQSDGPASAFQGLTTKQVMPTIGAPLSQEDPVGQAARYFVRFRVSTRPPSSTITDSSWECYQNAT